MLQAEITRWTQPPASRHLLFKGLTGFLLGFLLALWLSWLLGYGGLLLGFAPVRDRLAMWLAVLLWACAPCGVGGRSAALPRLWIAVLSTAHRALHPIAPTPLRDPWEIVNTF